MGSVAALMLMYMGEEETFWVLVTLTQDPKYAMFGLWHPKMPLIQQRFYQFERLVRIFFPKLNDHFEAEGIHTCSMYQASQWFITIFLATKVTFRLLLRIWDVYLAEGQKTVFRVGLALLRYYQTALANANFEDIINILSVDVKNLGEDFMPFMLKIKVTHTQLQQLEAEFHSKYN